MHRSRSEQIGDIAHQPMAAIVDGASRRMGTSKRGAVPGGGNLIETVKLLDNVAGQAVPNQRALARQIGISVGLVNALVHRGVRKGLIKIKEAPARRYAYYLTPKGFAEKSRLVAEYLDYSLTFFRIARQEYGDLFARCEAMGLRRLVLCGAGELAEIASLACHDSAIELVGIFDERTNRARVGGLPVFQDLTAVIFDGVVVVTDGQRPQETYDVMCSRLGVERVFVPAFLRVSVCGEDKGGSGA